MNIKSLGKTSLGMEANIAALLSYLLIFVSGVIVYIFEKENKFVRFHAMQSIVVFGFLFTLSLMLQFIFVVLWPLVVILKIAGIILWVILMVKAYKGEYFKLPIAGAIAEKNA